MKWRSTNLADCRVGLTDITPGCHVSTVFLGLDHRFIDEGAPLLFETFVFGGPLDMRMNRYSTWSKAERGHKSMVAQVRAACDQIKAIAEAAGAKA